MPKAITPQQNEKLNQQDFAAFGFKKFINDNLKRRNFTKPTLVQSEVIPLLKKHQNVIALSPTGTGKTYAFLLPLINNLKPMEIEQIQMVIVVPTRELGQQILQETRELLENQNQFKAQLFVGASDLKKEVQNLQTKQPTIAIGTPNRLQELYDQGALKLTTANALVVDEADMIFDYGFLENLDYLLNKMRLDLQTAFFSATIPQELSQFLKKYVKNPLFINLVPKKMPTQNIDHFVIETKEQNLTTTMNQLLASLDPFLGLIFVNNKNQVPEIVNILQEFGIKEVGELHGDLTPRARDAMLKRIKNNEFRYVVATDIAARGLDFPGTSHIISINLPKDWHYYIHRAGRTGRNGQHGESYVLKTHENQKQLEFLKTKGLKFTVLKFNQNQFKPTSTSKPKKKNLTLDPESQQVINRYAHQKVKPGYKQKRKAELESIKKNRRRQHIKESIQKIKKEKYQQRRETIFKKD